MFLPYVSKKVKRLLRLKEEYKFKIYWDGSCGMNKINTYAPQGVDEFILGTTVLFGKGRPYGDIFAGMPRLYKPLNYNDNHNGTRFDGNMNLWVVGNGLDIRHGYKTRYSDFKIWMDEQLGESLSDDVPDLPEVIVGNHGEEIVDEDKIIKVLMWLFKYNEMLDDNWSNFEESLYHLSFVEMLNENSWFVDDNSRDKEGDINPFRQGAAYRDVAEIIRVCVRYVHILFQRWIESVDVNETNLIPNLKRMADDSLFLSFNYTETLEKLYGIKLENICHIHGLRKGMVYWGTDLWYLIIGHGSLDKKDYSDINIEAADVLENIVEDLRKPTDDIVDNNLYFWQRILNSNINKVYSYGFSYGDVDLAYIRHIVRILKDKHITWYLHDYSEIDNSEFEKKLRKCGFVGRIERFGDVVKI